MNFISEIIEKIKWKIEDIVWSIQDKIALWKELKKSEKEWDLAEEIELKPKKKKTKKKSKK